ncbi:MAG: Fic family protein [Planctomycetaceae bacterium]
MDGTQFNSDSPGELVRLADGDSAFVPAPLPPNWTFPTELWPLLAEVKHLFGVLEGIGRVLPNPGLLLRPMADREAIRSSKLEGTYVTPTELLLFDMSPVEPTSETDPVNSQREVFNYRRALNEAVASPLPISLRLLRDMHRTLLTGVRGDDRSPGEFRQVQVYLGSSKRFIPPPPFRLHGCLDAFEKGLHQPVKFDPIVEAFVAHYQFETIHPFVDGNGRIGRLLLALMILQRCGFSKPWLYMSAFFERYRDEYVDRLFHVSSRGDWTGWIEFCLRGAAFQAKDTIERCERLLKFKAEFDERIGQSGGTVRLHQIVVRLFLSPFLRVADLARQLEVTYPTAKSDIDRLVNLGMLSELASISPKTFYSPDLFNLAYEDIDVAPKS